MLAFNPHSHPPPAVATSHSSHHLSPTSKRQHPFCSTNRCHLDVLPTELLLALFPLLDAPSLAFLARSCKRLWLAAIPHLYHSPDIPSLRTLQRLARTLACDAGIDQSNPGTYINLPDYPTKRRGRSHTPVDDSGHYAQHADHSPSKASSSDPRLLALYESSSPTTSPCRLIRHLRIVSLAAMSGKWNHASARIYAPALELLSRAVRRAYWLLTLTQPQSPAFSPTSALFAHSPCGFAALDLAHTWDLPDLTHLPDSTVQILALNIGPMLKSLDLEQCMSLGPNAVLALAAHCPNLQELRVADGPRVSDASLEGLATGCPHLLMLDVTGAEEMTSTGLRAIVGACHRLTEVKARGCFGILMSDDEVAEMVRETGRAGLVVEVGKRDFSDEDEDTSEMDQGAGFAHVFPTNPPLLGGFPEMEAGMNVLMQLNQMVPFDAPNAGTGLASGEEAMASYPGTPGSEEQSDEEVDQDDGFAEHVVSGEEDEMNEMPSFAIETGHQGGGGIEFDDGFMGALVGQFLHVPIVPASSVLAGTIPSLPTGEYGPNDQDSDDEQMWTDDE